MQAWLEVDLDAIRHNLGLIRQTIGPDVEIMAVVKADAYGHGIETVVPTMHEEGVQSFATISYSEALRVAKLTDRDILILGRMETGQIEEAIRHRFVLSIFDRDLADEVQECATRVGIKARCHLKVESGMNRLGIARPEAMEIMANLWQYDMLQMEGLYTHVLKSSDVEWNRRQLESFKPVMELAEALGLRVKRHMINSHALYMFPDGHLDLVRAGLAMYGVEEVIPGLRPSIAARTKVVQVKKIAKGEGVSYNHLYHAERDMEVAIIAMGYAEGYTQALTGKSSALIHGKRVPVIGQICMNLTIIDVTGMGVQRGDIVTLVGRDGDEEIRVNDLARWSGLRHHELVTRFGHGLRKVVLGARNHSETPKA